MLIKQSLQRRGRSVLLVHHRSGEIRDENKYGDGMRDVSNVNGGMRDKITWRGTDFAHFDGRGWG